ncbi:MAG: glycosyltransferase family protein [Myxococcota bacterium]
MSGGAGRRVHYYVHGRGRGHATRSEAIIQALVEQGYEVTAFGGEDAAPVIAPAVERFVPVPSVPHRPSLGAARIFAERVVQSVRTTWDGRPDFIVSDGDHPSVLAGRLWGCPVVAVGHGLVFSRCQRPAQLPRVPWLREAIKAQASSWPATDFVPVNFVPLPTSDASTVLARPILDRQIRPFRAVAEPRPGKRILMYFSEGNAAEILPLVTRVVGPDDELHLFSRRPAEEHRPRVQVHALNREQFLDHLKRADLVVASAGSQLISECVALKRPLFAIYRPEHDEQRLNVAMLEEAGAGTGCSVDTLSEEALAAFLRAPPGGTQALWRWSAPDAAQAVLQALERHRSCAS